MTLMLHILADMITGEDTDVPSPLLILLIMFMMYLPSLLLCACATTRTWCTLPVMNCASHGSVSINYHSLPVYQSISNLCCALSRCARNRCLFLFARAAASVYVIVVYNLSLVCVCNMCVPCLCVICVYACSLSLSLSPHSHSVFFDTTNFGI